MRATAASSPTRSSRSRKKYGLTVDVMDASALENILRRCPPRPDAVLAQSGRVLDASSCRAPALRSLRQSQGTSAGLPAEASPEGTACTAWARTGTTTELPASPSSLDFRTGRPQAVVGTRRPFRNGRGIVGRLGRRTCESSADPMWTGRSLFGIRRPWCLAQS